MSDGASTDPRLVQLIVNGVPILGRGGGQYLNLVMNREQFTENVGVDGEGFIVVVPDLSGRITCSLLQSSKSNDYLTQLWKAQINAPGNLAWPVQMLEKNGTTRFSLPRAFVTKLPDTGYSDSGEVRVWTLAATQIFGHVGGLDPTPFGEIPA